jgi:hypothetical protein
MSGAEAAAVFKNARLLIMGYLLEGRYDARHRPVVPVDAAAGCAPSAETSA